MSETETSVDSTGEGRSKRLSDAQWAEIRTLWELGEIKLAEIASKYGVSKQAIMVHFKKHGTVRNSRAEEVKAAVVAGVAKATVEAKVQTFADKRKQRIEDTREEHYQAAHYLSRLVNKLLVDASKAGKSPASIKEDLKALRMASAIQEQSFQVRAQVLNADQEIDENELPTLTIENLTDEDIAAIQAKQDEDDLGDESLLETYEDEDEEEGDASSA